MHNLYAVFTESGEQMSRWMTANQLGHYMVVMGGFTIPTVVRCR